MTRPGLAWITCTHPDCDARTTVYAPHAENIATYWRCEDHAEVSRR